MLRDDDNDILFVPNQHT